MKRQIITIIIALVATSAWAQREVTITGDVKDGFLKTPLTDAKVTICRADSTVLDTAKITIYKSGDQPLYAVYSSKVKTDANAVLVHAWLQGYDDVWQSVNITGQTEVEVPTLEMRKMREMELKEVVVKATRVKMFYRGDTLVYDATAFKLPDGSMLDALIRQMPGVTLNEAGQIFVNGRMVDELMLGSRSFFKGNRKVLLENLPYYTVQNIKVYDKQSDMSKALGYDVDAKSFVMDVNLKQEYQRGYIANVEGAVGTEDRWLARAFALGFSDHYRFTLLGNVNNVNESRHIGESGNWTPATMPKNMLTTRSVAGEIDYHAKEDKVKNNLTASYTSTTDVSESRSRYEQFLQGLTPTSLTESFSRASNRQWNARNAFTLTKLFYLYAVADFSYSKNHGAFSSMFDQWNDTLTASQRNRGFNEGKAWSGSIDAQGAFNVGKNQKHINFYVRAQHSENESESAMRYSTRQYVNPQQTVQHNVDDISNRTTWGIAQLNYNMKLFKGVEMQVGESVNLVRIDAHDYLYHPDTLLLASQIDALTAITDFKNSYDSRTNAVENTVGLSFSGKGKYKMNPNAPFTIDYQRWSVGISVPIRHESLDYQRGRLDTLARQNTMFVNTSASFRHASEDGKQDFRIHASHKRSAANLSDRITYRDDSQPLVVKLGNPDLKSFVTSNFGIDYSNKAGRNQQQWHVGTSADIYHRNADAGYHHSVDHAMLTGMTASEENVVNTLTLHDNAYIQFNKGTLNIRATGDIRWRHSEGKRAKYRTLRR